MGTTKKTDTNWEVSDQRQEPIMREQDALQEKYGVSIIIPPDEYLLFLVYTTVY